MTEKGSEVKAKNKDEEKDDEEINEKKPKKSLAQILNVKLNKKSKGKIAKYITVEPVLLSFPFIYLIFKLEQSYALLKVCIVKITITEDVATPEIH